MFGARSGTMQTVSAGGNGGTLRCERARWGDEPSRSAIRGDDRVRSSIGGTERRKAHGGTVSGAAAGTASNMFITTSSRSRSRHLSTASGRRSLARILDTASARRDSCSDATGGRRSHLDWVTERERHAHGSRPWVKAAPRRGRGPEGVRGMGILDWCSLARRMRPCSRPCTTSCGVRSTGGRCSPARSTSG